MTLETITLWREDAKEEKSGRVLKSPPNHCKLIIYQIVVPQMVFSSVFQFTLLLLLASLLLVLSLLLMSV